MERPAIILRVDLDAATPAYRQIVDGLRAQLVAGAIAPGEQLPTVRQLGVDLGVHHNTVAQAYRALADEGWLDLTRGRGATVRDRAAPRPTTKARTSWARRLHELVAQGLADGVPAADVAAGLDAAARDLTRPG